MRPARRQQQSPLSLKALFREIVFIEENRYLSCGFPAPLYNVQTQQGGELHLSPDALFSKNPFNGLQQIISSYRFGEKFIATDIRAHHLCLLS